MAWCLCALLCLQDLKFVGMMQYDGDLLLPANYLVPPPEIHKTSGEFLVHNGISTFACSETQKFGHVTFFWNGNRSGYFDSKLETYLEVGVFCGRGGGDGVSIGAVWCSGDCVCRQSHTTHSSSMCSICRAARLAVTDLFVCVSPPAGCLCGQIPSDKVPFNQLPDMKAYEITEAGKEALRSGKYKMVRTY
jgi:hypothetical protein